MTDRRRIVTGHDQAGNSTVASDELVSPRTSPGMPGTELLYLWGTDSIPQHPDAGVEPAWTQHFPPVGGFRFVTFTIPAANHPSSAESDSAEAQEHARASFPGLLETYREDAPGIHTSHTTDLAMVLTGEITLGLTDGSEHVLRQGDTVVQNGTAHSWTNRTNEPVEMVFVLVGAERVDS